MAVLVVGLSVGFPFISTYVVVPYLVEYGQSVFPFTPAGPGGSWATGSLAVISLDNLLIMALIVLTVIVCFLIFFGKGAKRASVEEVRFAQVEPGAQRVEPGAQRVEPGTQRVEPGAQVEPGTQDARAAKAVRPAKRRVPVYLGGVGLDFEKRTYRDSLSRESQASQRNWYLEKLFGEAALTPVANTMCVVILLLGAALALLNLSGLGGWSL
jgi:hypothetical protein